MSEIRASDPIASPHVHGGGSVGLTMRRVMYALTPATLFGLWLFGWPAINLFVITVGSCLAFEFACQRSMGQRTTLHDGSALLTGWLLALTLPPWAPWWTGVVGGFIAIVVGKQVFGGLGQNLFNPAMVARVALLVSFPVVMTQWVAPQPLTAPNSPGFVEGMRITLTSPPVPDAIASASLLGHAKTERSRGLDLIQAFAAPTAPAASAVGMRAGSLGESAALLIAAGGLYLFLTGVIGWQIPVAVLAGIAVPAAIAHGIDPARHLGAAEHLLSGAAMLGAFFIATDYVTSPNTATGRLLFGLGVGLLTWIIRNWGGYPEGMAFAVLLMNALTPVIDRYVKPRILGRRRDGRELETMQS
ncbi:MAG: RnfABCDGE type electron transport complex subunit D [Pseudomonadota bacterium]|jgi:RnfABCDGE-type electron transport complex D subunit